MRRYQSPLLYAWSAALVAGFVAFALLNSGCATGHIVAKYPDGTSLNITGTAIAHGRIEIACAPIPNATPGSGVPVASIEGGWLSSGAWSLLSQVATVVGTCLTTGVCW